MSDLIDREQALACFEGWDDGMEWHDATELPAYDRLQKLPIVVEAEDCISRAAAIKEFNCCELTPDGGIDVNYAIDFLNQLPSAHLHPRLDCQDYDREKDICKSNGWCAER